MSKKIDNEKEFKEIKFTDAIGNKCLLKEVLDDDKNGKCINILTSNSGLKKYIIPESGRKVEQIVHNIPNDVYICSKMVLNQDQVKELLPYLQSFANNGSIEIKQKRKRYRYIACGTATIDDKVSKYGLTAGCYLSYSNTAIRITIPDNMNIAKQPNDSYSITDDERLIKDLDPHAIIYDKEQRKYVIKDELLKYPIHEWYKYY